MIDGLSSVNRPVITYLTLGYLTLYEPSPPGALIPRRNQPEMWSAGLSDLGKVFVEGFHTLGPRGSSLGECRGTDTIGGTSAYSFVGKGGRRRTSRRVPRLRIGRAAEFWRGGGDGRSLTVCASRFPLHSRHLRLSINVARRRSSGRGE